MKGMTNTLALLWCLIVIFVNIPFFQDDISDYKGGVVVGKNRYNIALAPEIDVRINGKVEKTYSLSLTDFYEYEVNDTIK